MKAAKKILALLLIVCLVLSLAACGKDSGPTSSPDASDPSAPSSPAASDGIHVNVGVHKLITSWSPWLANNAGRASVIAQVFQPLVECDKDNAKAVCVLAKSFEKTDELTFRVYLHEDIYDHSGNHFTAEDAVFTLENFLEAGTVSASKNVSHVEYVDEYTLDVIMREGKGMEHTFGQSLSQGWCVTKAAWEASPDEMSNTPIGTGGYRVVDFVPSATVDLEKVEDYWGTGKVPAWHEANADTIHLEQIAEPSQITVGLETGMIDVAPLFPATELESFIGREGFTVHDFADYSPGVLFFNMAEGSPLTNLKLRQAIAYAIDTQEIIDGAMNGYGDPCSTWGASNMRDFVDSWAGEDYYGQDVEKAKQLLAESGFDTSRELVLMVENENQPELVGEILQLQLMDIGLNIKLDVLDGSAYSEYRLAEDKWDIRLDFAGSDSLIEWWGSYLGTQGRDTGLNWMFFKDETLDEMIYECGLPENFANDEMMTELKNYINENLYGYGLVSTTVFYVTVDTIEYPGVTLKYKNIAGGSIFSEDFGK